MRVSSDVETAFAAKIWELIGKPVDEALGEAKYRDSLKFRALFLAEYRRIIDDMIHQLECKWLLGYEPDKQTQRQ